MGTTRIGEVKTDKVTGKRTRKVTRDRKSYGRIEYHGSSPAQQVGIYWMQRRLDQFHHKEQAWVIEADPITAVKSYGARYIGIECPCGTRYLAKAEIFNPAATSADVRRERFMSYVDPWGRRGAMCWVVNIDCWAVQLPPEDERLAMTLKRMIIPRPRRRKTVASASKP